MELSSTRYVISFGNQLLWFVLTQNSGAGGYGHTQPFPDDDDGLGDGGPWFNGGRGGVSGGDSDSGGGGGGT